MSGAANHRGTSKQNYATPPEFIDAVVRRFGPLAFDLAADADNTKAPRFFSEADNSLVQEWRRIDGLLWLNPPFANIAPWARKCRVESQAGARIAFLVPASVGSNWFSENVNGHARVLFLNGRLKFDGVNGFPKDCMLAMYGWPVGFEVWRWTERIDDGLVVADPEPVFAQTFLRVAGVAG